MRRLLAPTLAAAMLAAGGWARDDDAAPAPPGVRVLHVSDERPDVGEALRLTQRLADGAGVEWIPPRWLYQKSAFTQRNFEFPVGEGGVAFAPDAPGAWMIGADLPERVETFEARDLGVFLGARSASPTPRFAGAVRVRRLESMTALARVPGEAASVAVWKNGQRAEIRSLLDPMAVELPSAILVRVYVDGSKLPGARVLATRGGRTIEALADAEGIARIDLDAPGSWRLEFHHVAPAIGEDHDLTLYSAALTFTAGEGGVR